MPFSEPCHHYDITHNTSYLLLSVCLLLSSYIFASLISSFLVFLHFQNVCSKRHKQQHRAVFDPTLLIMMVELITLFLSVFRTPYTSFVCFICLSFGKENGKIVFYAIDRLLECSDFIQWTWTYTQYLKQSKNTPTKSTDWNS